MCDKKNWWKGREIQRRDEMRGLVGRRSVDHPRRNKVLAQRPCQLSLQWRDCRPNWRVCLSPLFALLFINTPRSRVTPVARSTHRELVVRRHNKLFWHQQYADFDHWYRNVHREFNYVSAANGFRSIMRSGTINLCQARFPAKRNARNATDCVACVA